MKHEIIRMPDMQLVGISREIPFEKGTQECPLFWGEYYEKLIKPIVVDRQEPNALQSAVLRNCVGELAVCRCKTPGHNCASCCEDTTPNKTFTYTISGTYRGGDIPDGLEQILLPKGTWLKVWFEGGMSHYQEQHYKFFSEWLPAHPKFRVKNDSACIEWYNGTDLQSPDYQCGVMLPIE